MFSINCDYYTLVELGFILNRVRIFAKLKFINMKSEISISFRFFFFFSIYYSEKFYSLKLKFYINCDVICQNFKRVEDCLENIFFFCLIFQIFFERIGDSLITEIGIFLYIYL